MRQPFLPFVIEHSLLQAPSVAVTQGVGGGGSFDTFQSRRGETANRQGFAGIHLALRGNGPLARGVKHVWCRFRGNVAESGDEGNETYKNGKI